MGRKGSLESKKTHEMWFTVSTTSYCERKKERKKGNKPPAYSHAQTQGITPRLFNTMKRETSEDENKSSKAMM